MENIDFDIGGSFTPLRSKGKFKATRHVPIEDDIIETKDEERLVKAAKSLTAGKDYDDNEYRFVINKTTPTFQSSRVILDLKCKHKDSCPCLAKVVLSPKLQNIILYSMGEHVHTNNSSSKTKKCLDNDWKQAVFLLQDQRRDAIISIAQSRHNLKIPSHVTNSDFKKQVSSHKQCCNNNTKKPARSLPDDMESLKNTLKIIQVNPDNPAQFIHPAANEFRNTIL